MPTALPLLTENLSLALKRKAAELGFAACGIATAEPLQTHEEYRHWLARGYHASMRWMAREDAVAKRADVREVMPEARSVVCVAMHYRTEAGWDEPAHGQVARYARGDDYHDFMTPRLRELLAWIQQQTACAGRVYVDTGPILERELARRAGLGWIGKNTMLLSRELGSYFLIGEILLDIELEPDRPHLEQFCGTCTRCLDACPTDAFVAPYVLDANKCISFHTIENREGASKELRANFGDWVFGCDICQEVCPWNNKSQAHSGEPELWTRDDPPTLLELLLMPQAEYSARLKGSPMKRPKRKGMKRNALAVLKNRRRKSKAEPSLAAELPVEPAISDDVVAVDGVE
jgi:epoxyqueuosine reductase